MATEIKVPALGESVTEATVARWLKQVGDAVAMDDPLVELETDKVTLEVNAPAAGTLTEIAVAEGANVAVGARARPHRRGARRKPAPTAGRSHRRGAGAGREPGAAPPPAAVGGAEPARPLGPGGAQAGRGERARSRQDRAPPARMAA